MRPSDLKLGPETHPPILYEPTPPCHALTNEGSASRETGLKDPVAKYGPTGPTMTKIIAFPARDTPRDGWRGEGGQEGDRVRTSQQVGQASLFMDATAHLGSYEGGSDVQAGVQRVGNPLLVDLHQLPDALEQLAFIKELGGRRKLADDSLIRLVFLECSTFSSVDESAE